MANVEDRSLAQLVRETLGTKNILKFFPNPASPKDEKGQPGLFAEWVESALWWVADHKRVEIRDETSFVIPAEGYIRLDAGPGARVRKIFRVEQENRFFDEIATDWGYGIPHPRGHWHVRNRVFYVAGYGPYFRNDRLYGYDPHLLLHQGPVIFTYWGVPTEAQLAGNAVLAEAAVHYAAHLAFEDIAGRILRPKNIKLEGVPDIKHNAKDYREHADWLEKSALDLLGSHDAVTGHDGGVR